MSDKKLKSGINSFKCEFIYSSTDFIEKVGDGPEMRSDFDFLKLCVPLLMLVKFPVESTTNLGGRAIRRGRLVRLNSLLNASVMIFEIVFSNIFSIIEPNTGELKTKHIQHKCFNKKNVLIILNKKRNFLFGEINPIKITILRFDCLLSTLFAGFFALLRALLGFDFLF